MQTAQQRTAVLPQLIQRQYERAMLAASCVKTLDHSAWIRELIGVVNHVLTDTGRGGATTTATVKQDFSPRRICDVCYD
jgi:hypothetical protein